MVRTGSTPDRLSRRRSLRQGGAGVNPPGLSRVLIDVLAHIRVWLGVGALALPLACGGAVLASASVSASSAAAKPLAGKIVGIDPGHNGRNWTDPAFLNRQVWNGREWEDCDTTGTETAGGYTEAKFNWNVATYLRADLSKEGAKVVLTRQSNNGIGPCVNRRARILDNAHANVSIDIHADYAPASGRGFTILEPVADTVNKKVVKPSLRFATDVHAAMLTHTAVPISDYYGRNGYIRRDDLAGLNLTTMPKVLIECGNMNNRADAAMLVRPKVQQNIAKALAAAITRFLTAK
ncbi:MAG TPA: N-acetylmuramoyl-L-alanine amidase [Streptosporangiaceae bacterium]|jgi:N-acetylmuramoyl-L-alanine amidase